MFLFIVLYWKTIAQNSIRLIFHGIAKIFIDPMGLVKTRPAWTMFFKLKALVQKVSVIIFSIMQKMIIQDFNFQAWFHMKQ